MAEIVVVGASGLIGWHIYEQLLDANEDVLGTYCHNKVDENLVQLEISNPSKVEKFLDEHNPYVIYLPAAYTDVDGCERNPELSYKINVLGVKYIVDWAKRAKHTPHIKFFSSGYIFDGDDSFYLSNHSIPNPLNVYGVHKLIAEHYIMSQLSKERWSIFRVMFVYGWEHQQKNFVYSVLRALERWGKFYAYNDHLGTPTYAPEVAKLAIQTGGEINHISSEEVKSKYRWAGEIAEVFGYKFSDIVPIGTNERKQVAKRPYYAGVDSDYWNYHPVDVKSGLEAMKLEMEKRNE